MHRAILFGATVSAVVVTAWVGAVAEGHATATTDPCGRCVPGTVQHAGHFHGFWNMSGLGCDDQFICSVCSEFWSEELGPTAENPDSDSYAESGGAETDVPAANVRSVEERDRGTATTARLGNPCLAASDTSGEFETQSEAQAWVEENGCNAHLCNGGSEELIQELVEVAIRRDPEALAALIQSSRGLVALNERRSAIQGGCNKGVLNLHLPLDESLASETRALLAAPLLKVASARASRQ